MMGFRGIDITVALYIVAFLALYLLLGPAREGMKKKGSKKDATMPQMMKKKKKTKEDDDDDDDVKQKFENTQQLAAAAKAFVASQPQGGLKVDIDAKNKKKKGIFVHVKIKGAQGIEFNGETRVDSTDALKSAKNMLTKMFASPPFASRIDVADRGFKKGTAMFDTVAALTQGAATALATAKSQGVSAANVVANKKWDGTGSFVHVTVYGRKTGEKNPAFFFRGYSRLDNDATLLAAHQTLQQAIVGLQEPGKFRAFLIGNRMSVATSAPAASITAVPMGTVLPTLAPTQCAAVPPTVSLPPMSSGDPLATMPPLITAAAIM